MLRFKLSVLLLFIPFFLFGQNAVRVWGKVTNWDGQPLIGALVFLHELNKGTLSDQTGNYEFKNIRPGTYHFHITYLGHESLSRTLIVTERDVKADFALKPSTIELNEILVEANPFKSGPVEQSMTIETVDRTYLLENSGGSLMGALQKLPGISTINTGVGIAKPVIRGMSFNRVIVNDRGIKQEGQQWGGDHGLEIDQYEPNRIEIIKGPASLLYGSDAMGGVVNIQPAPIPVEGSLSGSGMGILKSNNNLYGASFNIKGNKKGKFFSLRLSAQDFADYKVPADFFTYNSFTDTIENNKLENTAGKEKNITGTVGISKNWGYSKVTVSNFHQKVGFFPGAIGIPGAYQVAKDGNRRDIALPRQVVNHFKIISNSNISLGGNWLEVDLGYQSNTRKEEGVPHAHGLQNPTEGTLALGLDLHTFSLNAKYHYQKNENYNAIYGVQGQYQENHFSGFEFLLPAFNSYSIGIYNYHEISFDESWTINGGLRVDYGVRDITKHVRFAYETEAPDDSTIVNENIYRDFLNFSGAIGISYYPHHNINAKFNLGTSFRMPSAPELSMNGIHHGTFRHEKGSSNLNSERGFQTDFNLTYHTKALHIGVTPFFSYYDQFIYLKPSAEFSGLPGGGQIYQYEQNNAVFSGGEVSTEYHFIHNLHTKVSAEYVWNLNVDSKRPLPFTPPFSILGEVRYEIPIKSEHISSPYASIDAQFFSAQNRIDQNEKTTPGYHLLSFNAGLRVKLRNQEANIIFAVQNLLNKKYLNHLSRYRLLNLPEQGRNYVLSVQIPFSIVE